MRKIEKPDSCPKGVFLTCISYVKNPELKQRFESISDTIKEKASEFEQHAQTASWYLIKESHGIGDIIAQEEMEKIYTQRMAKEGAPGRPIYDQLKIKAHQGQCPLCGHRKVNTLDHYLPQSKFPALVVAPHNLIPSCSDCNTTKRARSPKSSETQILHPYYDDVSQHQWLYAEVIESSPVIFDFYVKAVEQFDDVLNARIQYHFEILKLNELYISHAATNLGDIVFSLEQQLKTEGVDAVKKHLREVEVSSRHNHINSWKTALYQAMSNSDWFCNGGFSNS